MWVKKLCQTHDGRHTYTAHILISVVLYSLVVTAKLIGAETEKSIKIPKVNPRDCAESTKTHKSLVFYGI